MSDGSRGIRCSVSLVRSSTILPISALSARFDAELAVPPVASPPADALADAALGAGARATGASPVDAWRTAQHITSIRQNSSRSLRATIHPNKLTATIPCRLESRVQFTDMDKSNIRSSEKASCSGSMSSRSVITFQLRRIGACSQRLSTRYAACVCSCTRNLGKVHT